MICDNKQSRNRIAGWGIPVLGKELGFKWFLRHTKVMKHVIWFGARTAIHPDYFRGLGKNLFGPFRLQLIGECRKVSP